MRRRKYFSARKRASEASALRRAAAFSNENPTKWVSFESLSKNFFDKLSGAPIQAHRKALQKTEGRFPLYTLKSFLPLSLKNTRSDTIEVRVRIVE